MQILKEALALIDELNSRGFGAWAVGALRKRCGHGRSAARLGYLHVRQTGRDHQNVRGAIQSRSDGIKHGRSPFLTAAGGIEVTTLRADGRYLDGRRPEEVRFVTDRRKTCPARFYDKRHGL